MQHRSNDAGAMYLLAPREAACCALWATFSSAQGVRACKIRRFPDTDMCHKSKPAGLKNTRPSSHPSDEQRGRRPCHVQRTSNRTDRPMSNSFSVSKDAPENRRAPAPTTRLLLIEPQNDGKIDDHSDVARLLRQGWHIRDVRQRVVEERSAMWLVTFARAPASELYSTKSARHRRVSAKSARRKQSPSV